MVPSSVSQKGAMYGSTLRKTSPYKFYQYWINTSDADAQRYIKIFTMLPKEEIETLTAEHLQAPHLRILQNKLAEELTLLVRWKRGMGKGRTSLWDSLWQLYLRGSQEARC